MKKNGFVLVETLIATTLIAVVFTIIYIEFGVINDNYKKTYNNNSVEKIYAVNNIKNFILADGYESFKSKIDDQDLYFKDVTNCEDFINQSQCTNLVNTLDIDKIVYINEGFNSFLRILTYYNQEDAYIYNYVSSYISPSDDIDYILVKFKDKQIAALSLNQTINIRGN